jgi:hypothetical protein
LLHLYQLFRKGAACCRQGDQQHTSK